MPPPLHSLDSACTLAEAFFPSWAAHQARSKVLLSIAQGLDVARVRLIQTAADETALTPEELLPEFDRMVGTLRMLARLITSDAWRRPAIDRPVRTTITGGSQPGAIGPNHDVRSALFPLGPVVVFGASNFPLAYGVCGGDTASALAAGCPVIVKEHPAHPRTGALIAEVARKALRKARFDIDLLQYVPNPNPRDRSVAKALVTHPAVRAVGFTGSTAGGTAIAKLAAERKHPVTGGRDPIPVFAEMGSCNVILIMPAALDARAEQIAADVAASLLTRVGQQCTAPGVVLTLSHTRDGPKRADHFYDLLRQRCGLAPALDMEPRRMLAPNVASGYFKRLDEVIASSRIDRHSPLPTPEHRARHLGTPVILRASAQAMAQTPTLFDEIFGPAVIVADANVREPDLSLLPGSLTVTLIADSADHEPTNATRKHPGFLGSTADILARVQRCAGRIILNGVPTGVRVCDAMVHSGPFPSSNVPHTTAVGPRALERWCRPIAFQNTPAELLPALLRD